MMKSSRRCIWLGLLVWLSPWVAAEASSTAAAALPLYERYVAIDGVCAWPQLTKMPDGTLSVLIWPHPHHGNFKGAVEAWRSTDEGRTWSRAGVPVPNDPQMNRMNHAGGLAADGSYIALVSGWDFLPDRPRARAVLGSTLAPVPAVSRDQGLTWTQYPEVPAPAGTNDKGMVPFGRVHPLPDGKLGVMLYSTAVFFYVSSDGGQTWEKRGQVTENILDLSARTHNETTWIVLRNGDLYAASRTFRTIHLEGFRSRDLGATWTSEGPLTLPRQHPADLTALPDGRILLSYGVRNQHTQAIHYRVADAAARTWSPPLTLVDLEGATDDGASANPRRDGGYPSTVVLDDGTLVTAYYSRGMPTHQRYHVGVVRWRLDSLRK